MFTERKENIFMTYENKEKFLQPKVEACIWAQKINMQLTTFQIRKYRMSMEQTEQEEEDVKKVKINGTGFDFWPYCSF